jgi:hypothetical protein
MSYLAFIWGVLGNLLLESSQHRIVGRKEESFDVDPIITASSILSRDLDEIHHDSVGIVTVPVQDGWTDGRTDNRPVPPPGHWSAQHAVPSLDGSEHGRPVHRKTEGRTGDSGRNFCL